MSPAGNAGAPPRPGPRGSTPESLRDSFRGVGTLSHMPKEQSGRVGERAAVRDESAHDSTLQPGRAGPSRRGAGPCRRAGVRAPAAGKASAARLSAMPRYSYGGQALIEGVLMRGRDAIAVALRHP